MQYYPATIFASPKKAISNIDQKYDESLYDYQERFKRLCAKFPYHGYSYEDLILYFCVVLGFYDLRMVNAANGRGIVNKIPGEAIKLITELAEIQGNLVEHLLHDG